VVCQRDFGIANLDFPARIPGLKRFLDAAGCIMDLG
jgi:hypothetical protein